MGINDHVNKIKLSLLIVPISGSIIRYVGRGGGGAGEGPGRGRGGAGEGGYVSRAAL